MKKLAYIFWAIVLLPNSSYALDAAIKGFIALEAVNYTKIHRSNDSLSSGIGVLDLKIFAEQDNMTAAIKLNIDGNLSVQNTLFEEAYATYRGIRNWKITLGKGIVKFQNLHYGAIQNTYLDGGSVLQTENSWRKVSNKALFSIAYGNRGIGFTNMFTIWGDTQEIQFDEKNNPKFITSGGTGTQASPKVVSSYETKSVPAFTTQKQLGVANKFELYKTENLTLTTGQIYFKNKLQDKASYAFDFGATIDGSVWEFWLDTLYGFTSKAPYENYTTFRKNEYFIQSGLLYHINEFWSIITNIEYMHVKDHAHTYAATFTLDGTTYYTPESRINKSGQTVVSDNYKIELAGQLKLSKSSFLTSGIMYEKKIAVLNGAKDLDYIKGVYNPNTEAFQFDTNISFWF